MNAQEKQRILSKNNELVADSKVMKVNFIKKIFKPKFIRSSFGYIALIILFIGFGIAEESFWTFRNFTTILQQASVPIIAGCGMTFIILAGSIDLSIGSLVGLAAVLTAGYGELIGLPGFAVGILAGLLCGVFSGFLVSKVKIPSFIATMGMLIFARGLVYIYTLGRPIPITYQPMRIFSPAKIFNYPNKMQFGAGMFIQIF